MKLVSCPSIFQIILWKIQKTVTDAQHFHFDAILHIFPAWKLLLFCEYLIQSPCNVLPITARCALHCVDIVMVYTFEFLNAGFSCSPVSYSWSYWGHSQIWKLINKEKSTNNLLVFVILMQFAFILVQLDSGQFQENSQEYLRYWRSKI